MARAEPRLRPDDERVYDAWMRAASAHARTRAHAAKLERARAAVADALGRFGPWTVMVSGGKDSAVLGHLVAAASPGVPWTSEKDDLDYPGEREYVEQLAAACRAPLTIVEPTFSVWERFAADAAALGAWEDIHSRASAFSRDAFYTVVEAATKGASLFLGLRAEESRGRAMNRYSRGLTYAKRSGQVVCQPLADWTVLDVYAYVAAHGLELLPVYRCVALQHRDAPGSIRKAWWVGGAANATGHVRWLAHYWPSLFARLLRVMPHARMMT